MIKSGSATIRACVYSGDPEFLTEVDIRLEDISGTIFQLAESAFSFLKQNERDKLFQNGLGVLSWRNDWEVRIIAENEKGDHRIKHIRFTRIIRKQPKPARLPLSETTAVLCHCGMSLNILDEKGGGDYPREPETVLTVKPHVCGFLAISYE